MVVASPVVSAPPVARGSERAGGCSHAVGLVRCFQEEHPASGLCEKRAAAQCDLPSVPVAAGPQCCTLGPGHRPVGEHLVWITGRGKEDTPAVCEDLQGQTGLR